MPIANRAPANDDLEEYEVELRSINGMCIGDRVRVTELWSAKMEVAGIGSDYIAVQRGGGRIIRIVAHSAGIWHTVYVRTDSGHIFASSASQLEAIR